VRDGGQQKTMTTKKRIPLADLKTNTFYNAPMWLDDSFLLLTADIPLSEILISQLKTWGFTEVWSESSVVSSKKTWAMAPSEVSGAVLDINVKEHEGRQIVKQFFEELAAFTMKTYTHFNNDNILDMATVTDKVKSSIQMLKDNRSNMLRMPDLTVSGIEYLYTHSVRSMFLSLSIGEALKLPNFRLIELGIATLLHEIGMMKIPKQIYKKSTALTENEQKLISTHPTQGMRMLQTFTKDNAFPLAQEILLGVWQHHERSNGTGYPKGLKGDSITVFGKIIAVACSYDALITNRPHKESIDSYTGMLLMLKQMHSLYDEKVISALLNSISIFPLGSYVQLKSGAIGIVVDIGHDPRYPVVKVYLDESQHSFKEPLTVATREEEGLAVERVLGEQEVQSLVSSQRLPDVAQDSSNTD